MNRPDGSGNMTPSQYRKERTQRGLTQAALAALLGVPREAVVRREAGTQPMFWRRWKQCGREIRQGYVSLRKLGKAQWEVVLWINRETLPEAIARGLLPSAEPERVPVPVGECPF